MRLELAPGERHACLTVNEYETLLMQHDLTDVLREPFRFAVEKVRHVWNEPHAVPLKARAYAQYDLLQAVNQLVDVLGLPTSRLERWIAQALATPVERLFGVKRSVDLLVSDESATGRPAIVEGTYQSPILIHWRGASEGVRTGSRLPDAAYLAAARGRRSLLLQPGGHHLKHAANRGAQTDDGRSGHERDERHEHRILDELLTIRASNELNTQVTDSLSLAAAFGHLPVAQSVNPPCSNTSLVGVVRIERTSSKKRVSTVVRVPLQSGCRGRMGLNW